ncbi:hypothetical protein FNB79_15265 [Formosa sediminum]|uniref:DUF4878 domain-containing protein n=1 Tax=Formosa sediminum TaxID=2594004 RepID=A0A516GUS8_9FLAO|nr:hypothetical protein [Formosa sediminum]QDO95273.1 hypothetical protein FNB79_15265 [Formosa sediminum]
MKHLFLFTAVFFLISCSENKTYSPSETAKIVAESFYHNDTSTLKEYTTTVGYSNLKSIQDMFIVDKDSDINFKVLDEAMDGDIAWIKYTTKSDPTPGVFKLIKENGTWKVTHNGPRDRGPF